MKEINNLFSSTKLCGVMKKLSLLFTCIYLFTAAAAAQSYKEAGSQAVINYKPKEYKAGQQNWAITQNKSGIMYFGNGQGLLEFDGNNWRLYPVPNNSVIRSLAIGEDGKIYVGAQSELGYFSPDSLGLMTFNSLTNFMPKDKRNFSDVWKTYVYNGNVYFRTDNYIFIWNIQKKGFKIIHLENSFPLMFNVNGTMYVLEWKKGLEVLKDDSLMPVKGGNKFANEKIYVMLPFPGEDGTSLIVTRTMGLFKYNGTNFIPFKTEADKFIKDNLIYSPGTVLSDGNILLSTLNGGAVVIDTAGKEVRKYSIGNGIISNQILFTFQDRSGAIWLATQNGISKIEYSSPVSYFDSRNNLTTTPIDIIRHNGIIYTATNNGVFSLNPNTSEFHLLKNSNFASYSLVKIKNELLAGTNGGLFKVEKDKLIPIKKTVGYEYVIGALKQSRLNPDRIYVGTMSGLWSVLKIGNRWKDEGRIIKNSDQPTRIVEDKDGKVWMSTFSSGIFRVTFQKDNKGNIILKKPVIKHFDKTNGLPGGYSEIDKINGKKYFLTVNGIYTFNKSKKMFSSDTTDKVISLFHKTIPSNSNANYFGQDKLGRLWIGSKGKLTMCILQSDSSWKRVSSLFYRIANEPITNIYAEKNGNTWFGVRDGLIKYDFKKKIFGKKDYSALVRRVDIGEDSTIYFGGKLDKPVTQEIIYNKNSIKFRYSATSFEGKNVNKFKTFLDGFDEDWSKYSKETRKEYTNLPPGKYIFKVEGLNPAGIKSRIGTYSFEILPPWYRTWWAYAFYVLALGFGIFIVDRTQRKRIAAKERERAENERKTQELEEARKLQLSMLPKDVPQIPNLDIAVYMQTATEVGGDYYDFSTGNDGSINICVGDATGHGMKAGTLVTMLKGLFIAISPKNSIKEFFATTNAAIKNSNLKRMMVCFAMLNISDHKATLINAGLPPVYIYRKDKNKVEEIDNKGMPLGAMSNFPYKETKTELKSGDVIYLLSDGFPELYNNEKEMYGYERVIKTFKEVAEYSSKEIIEKLKNKVIEWSAGKTPEDDVTFVVIKMK